MRRTRQRRFFMGMDLAVCTAAMNNKYTASAKNEPTACPFLKEVVMIYCDACPQHKLLPRNQVVSMGPCSSTDFTTCPLYSELAHRAAWPSLTKSSEKTGRESEAKS